MSFEDEAGTCIGTAHVPATELGWWTMGWRDNRQQSWKRPFMLGLSAGEWNDAGDTTLFSDTGVAYAHFDQAPHMLPGMGAPALFGGLFGMPLMSPMPEFKMPLPRTGRPDRAFPGVWDYLDESAYGAVASSYGEQRIRPIGSALLGGKPDKVDAHEAEQANKLAADYASYDNTVFTFSVNQVLDRTSMRMYEFRDESGKRLVLYFAVAFYGYDLLYYPVHVGRRASPLRAYPFGKAPLGDAEIYEVQWMATKRFGGTCPLEGVDLNEYFRHVVRFGKSMHFSDALMKEMRAKESALWQQNAPAKSSTATSTGGSGKGDSLEQARREREKLERDRREQERRERQERERQERERERQERMKRWDRKMELDRRNRHQWDAAIRGVDQYVGPDGYMVEVRSHGPSARAYYDRFSNTILHTEGRPDGWEELPEWKW